MYKAVKRALDVVAACLSLLILWPLLLLCAAAIKLDDGGPVLFRQRRPGKHEKIFTVMKFRTMRVETERNGVKLGDMERMTRVGKVLRSLSLDELPQLFNVLRGDMSFIGPRPLLVEYLERYSPEQRRRHEVRPGISGWAQVHGRNAISWEKKFELDCWYVDHMSLAVDLRIAWMTVVNILRREGINSAADQTMTPFMGSPSVQEVTAESA